MPSKVTTPRTTRNSRGLRRSPSVSSIDSDDHGGRITTGRVSKLRGRKAKSAVANSGCIDKLATAIANDHATTPNPDAGLEEPTGPGNSFHQTILQSIEEEVNPATPERNGPAYLAGDQEAAHHTSVADPIEGSFQPSASDDQSAPTQPSTTDTSRDYIFSPKIIFPAGLDKRAWYRRIRAHIIKEHNARKPLIDETKEFQERRTAEGEHLFARELYQSIRNDHFMRRCTCGPLKIYSSKKEAIKGSGHLRFYTVNDNPFNFRVLQHRIDLGWHCTCSKTLAGFYKDHINGTLKRRATDPDVDILESNQEISGAALRGGGRRVRRRIEREITPEEDSEPMFAHAVGLAKDIGMSLFKYLGQVLFKPVVEEPPKDRIVVRRFKRQYCLPQDSTEHDEPQVKLAEIPEFSWTSDPTRYIGKGNIETVLKEFERQLKDIRTEKVYGGADWETVRRSLGSNHDPGLCRTLHDFITDNLGSFSAQESPEERQGKWLSGLAMYEEAVRQTLDFIYDMYLFPRPFDSIQTKFPTPPTPPTLGNFEVRIRMKHVGEFLLWLVQKRHIFNTSKHIAEALAKMVADAKAVHKQEHVPSWVQFPGHNMGGALADRALAPSSIYDEVFVDDMVIEPVYAVKFPSPETPSVKAPTRQPGKTLIWDTPKPILKTTSNLPIVVNTAKYVPIPEKKRKLTFQEPVAAFAPPTKLPTKLLSSEDKLPRDEQRHQLRYYASKYGDLLDHMRDNVEAQRKDKEAGIDRHSLWINDYDDIEMFRSPERVKAVVSSKIPAVKAREGRDENERKVQLTPKEYRDKADEDMRAAFERKNAISKRLAELRENPIFTPETKRKAMNSVPDDPSTPEGRRRLIYGEDTGESKLEYQPRLLFAKPAQVDSHGRYVSAEEGLRDMLRRGILTDDHGFAEVSKMIRESKVLTATQRLSLVNELHALVRKKASSKRKVLNFVATAIRRSVRTLKRIQRRRDIMEATQKVAAKQAELKTVPATEAPEIQKKLEAAKVELDEARKQNIDDFFNEDDEEAEVDVLSAFLRDTRLDAGLKVRISEKKREEINLRTQIKSELISHLQRTVKEAEARVKAEAEKERLAKLAAEEAERKRLEKEEEARERRQREASRTDGLRLPRRRLIPEISEFWDDKLRAIRNLQGLTKLGQASNGETIFARNVWDTLLKPGCWLSDTVVGWALAAAARSIKEQIGDSDKKNPKMIALTQDFYNWLRDNGATKSIRTARRQNITKERFNEIELILFPICQDKHWTLAVVRPQDKIISHIDSMQSGRGDESVRQLILSLVKKILGEEFDAAEWKVGDHYTAPTQTNGFDCGVFTICNGICLMLGVAMDEAYSSDELIGARKWIAAQLLKGGFKDELSFDGI